MMIPTHQNVLKYIERFSYSSDLNPQQTFDFLTKSANILVVGAGGLGCEMIKNLVMMGIKNIHIIDSDTVELTNLNRQLFFTKEDIGKPKAYLAADFIRRKIPDGNIKGHNYKAEKISYDFYKNFHLILSAVDTIETRRWLNHMVNNIVTYDENDNIVNSSVIPLIDGGTEGLKGHVRIVIPGYTSCIECDLSLFSREEVYPLCTITNTPRRIEHCLELARTSVWDSHNPFRSNLDIKNENHFQWIYEQSVKIAQNHKIDLVSQEKALNIIKNIIPAVISTNSTIAAICVSECFKIITSHSESMSGFLMLNLSDGVYTNTLSLEKNAFI